MASVGGPILVAEPLGARSQERASSGRRDSKSVPDPKITEAPMPASSTCPGREQQSCRGGSQPAESRGHAATGKLHSTTPQRLSHCLPPSTADSLLRCLEPRLDVASVNSILEVDAKVVERLTWTEVVELRTKERRSQISDEARCVRRDDAVEPEDIVGEGGRQDKNVLCRGSPSNGYAILEDLGPAVEDEG
jgi:hypothetical protein